MVYAIGDVHGCLAPLRNLVENIKADATTAGEGETWIVLIGDYIDRGPQSAGVLDWLLAAPPRGFRRIALRGNHEEMMLDFLGRPRADHIWLRNGGDETLRSYGIEPQELSRLGGRALSHLVRAHIPGEHIELLQGLPLSLSLPGTVFVHAGCRPDIPVYEQSESELLWGRVNPPLTSNGVTGPRVVHGHTPGIEPFVSAERICIDTGAFATDRLTAARLTPDGRCSFLTGRSESIAA